MKSFAALLGSFLLLSMLGVAAYGQNAGTGAIAGVVTDPTGAVIEGGAIKVTNNLTGETRTAVSAGRGNYTEPLLPPGTYTPMQLAALVSSSRQSLGGIRQHANFLGSSPAARVFR